MTDEKILSTAFEDSRAHLRGVAYRMVGSLAEAEDAIQETWLRLSRADTAEVDNLRGWLTTVTARVCLDMLRSRKARAEEPVEKASLDTRPTEARNVEQEAVLADSVGLALLVVLQTLEPAERLAFVLHDLFGISFEEIAPIVGRTPVAARQLASRARRRVRGAPAAEDEAELARRSDVVRSLLAALRAGDVEGVVAVLDPNVVVHAQSPDGTPRVIHGARDWATSAVAFNRAMANVTVALVDGVPGFIFAPKGRLARALRFTFTGPLITRVDVIADPNQVGALEIGVLDDASRSRFEET